jgi:glutamate 5-kinase
LSETGRGTLFLPERAAPARKAWLAGRLTARGEIYIDAGALAALRSGKSLLAAGATRVAGAFRRGDLVAIIGPDGAAVARGLAEYDADEAQRLCGRRSDDHASILGYTPRAALVHRNHMAVL